MNDEDGMETESEGFSGPPSLFFPVGLALLSTAIGLVAAGVLVQAAWNAGVMGCVHAAGGHLGSIGFSTGVGIAVLILGLRWVIRAH